MTESPMHLLIRGPESQAFERKRSLALQREALETLCGMLNADIARGTLGFGIAPDGQMIGVEPGNLDKAQRSLSQTIGAKFEPRLHCTMEVVEIKGKRLLVTKLTWLLKPCMPKRQAEDSRRGWNLRVKKISKAVLSRCEWGEDDCSLKVENLPKAPLKPGQRNLLGEEAEP